MSEFVCIRSSVMVKRNDDSDERDKAFRLEMQSVVHPGAQPDIRTFHTERIGKELVKRGLLFGCSIGRLHHQELQTQGFTKDDHWPITVEELDLSF